MDIDILRDTVVFVIITMFPHIDGVPVLTVSRRPVIGESLVMTCTGSTDIATSVVFLHDGAIKGGCTDDGVGYECNPPGMYEFSSAISTGTMAVRSVDETRDRGAWRCRIDGGALSPTLNLTSFASKLDWSRMLFSSPWPSLPSSVSPGDNITVTVTTPCVKPVSTFIWSFKGISSLTGSPVTDSISSTRSTTSTSTSSCTAGLFHTVNSLSLPASDLKGRKGYVIVRVEHDSFDPPTYINSAQTSTQIQFPVEVSSVSLLNISKNNDEIEKLENKDVTLTCQTSASLPVATVTWYGTPADARQNDTTERTLTDLKTRISSVTFTSRRTHNNRRIHCEAAINGQSPSLSSPSQSQSQSPSLSSLTATVRVVYGPDQSGVNITGLVGDITESRDLTLTCRTVANPGVTFRWTYNDGSPVTGSVVASPGSTWSQDITFRPMRDKTHITCFATNTRFTSLMASATIHLGDVKYLGATLSPTPATLDIGGLRPTDTFSVRCTPSSPSVLVHSITVGKNDSEANAWAVQGPGTEPEVVNTLTVGNRLSTSGEVSTTGSYLTLTLSDLQCSDAGSYYCEVNASLTSSTSSKISTASVYIASRTFPENLKVNIRPGKTQYDPGQLVELYCSGNLGNQVNTSRPDTFWVWESTSENIENRKWQTQSKSAHIIYNIPRIIQSDNRLTTYSKNNSQSGCLVTGTTSLFHVIQNTDDGRHFRCSVLSQGHMYSSTVTLNVVNSVSGSNTSVGLAVGVTLGVCIPVIVGLVILAICLRRRSGQNTSDSSKTVSRGDIYLNPVPGSDPPSDTPTHVYDGLQDREHNVNTYEELDVNPYENPTVSKGVQ